MTIFLDTGVLVAAVNTGDRLHARSVAVLERVADGAWGSALTSDLVLVEGLTFLRSRVRHPKAETLFARLIVGGETERIVQHVLKVHGSRFQASLELFQRTFDRGLSFTDCSSLVLMRAFHIPRVATFDRGFRGFAEIVDEP